MKKVIATFISLLILSMTVLPAAAQERNRTVRRAVSTRQSVRYRDPRYVRRYDENVYRNEDVYINDDVYSDYPYEDDRSVWEKHRDKITTAGGAVGGALLGGAIGGKKGAIIGAIAGGAGAAIYTYKTRDKNYRY